MSTRELAQEALAAIALGKAKYERIALSYPVDRLTEDDRLRLRRATLDAPLGELYALLAELFPDRTTTCARRAQTRRPQ